MKDKVLARIRAAVADWAEQLFNSDQIYIGTPAEDDDEDEKAKRFLVDFAVRNVGYWQVAEVWVLNGRVVSINDLGEGLPLDNTEWPWPEQEVH